MYFQRDYILRMIEMVGDLLRRIRDGLQNLITKAELDKISGQACGMPLSLLESADPETLRDILDEPRRYLAAQLLIAQAALESPSAPDDEALLPARMQALSLLSSLKEADFAPSAASEAARILPYVLDSAPVALLMEAATLLEAGGAYAPAEDALYAALDQGAENTKEIDAFYSRLLAKTDADVRLGGLSHEEVNEGKEELKRRMS